MSANNFLDFEGLQTYHDELIKRLTDLEYDPERLFEHKVDLFSLSRWGANKYGRVVGLKTGLIITVEGQIWQLEDPVKFNRILSRIQSPDEKAAMTPEELGWKIVGSTVDFNINNHTLELTK